MSRFIITLLFLTCLIANNQAATGILTSRTGYNTGNQKRALVRMDGSNFLDAPGLRK